MENPSLTSLHKCLFVVFYHDISSGTCLCDAGSVQQLKPVKRKELHQNFNVLHMRLAVSAAVVLFRPVQPRHHVSTQVTVVEAAHFGRV